MLFKESINNDKTVSLDNTNFFKLSERTLLTTYITDYNLA